MMKHFDVGSLAEVEGCLRSLDRRSDLEDLTGEFHPWDVWVHAFGRRVLAGYLEEVGSVESGGANADQELVILWRWIRVARDRHRLSGDDDGAHGLILGTPAGRSRLAPDSCQGRPAP